MSFTQELADKVCIAISEGRSLRSIARELGIPESNIRLWEKENPDFAAQSMRAREVGCHSLADECLEIADDASNDWMETRDKEGGSDGVKFNAENVQRSRLRIDTRFRLLGKWLPKVYGEKLELAGNAESPLQVVVQRLTDASK